MARLPDPTLEPSPRARKLFEKLAAKRGRVDGMYRSLLNHPDLLEHVAQLGSYFRFGDSKLPDDLRELAILYTARRLGAAYEWVKHEPAAQQAGLGAELIQQLKAGQKPSNLSPGQENVLAAANCVLERRSIPQDLQNSLEKRIGREALIELVVLCGFYLMIAGVVFAFEVPLPEGSIDPF